MSTTLDVLFSKTRHRYVFWKIYPHPPGRGEHYWLLSFGGKYAKREKGEKIVKVKEKRQKAKEKRKFEVKIVKLIQKRQKYI